MSHLVAYPSPLGVFPAFIARQPESIVLKEKILSITGDSFDIKTVAGVPFLKVEGKAFSLSGRKNVYDMQGNHVFTIKKEHLHIHTTFVGEDPAGNKLFEVKSKFSIGSSKAITTFTSSSGKAESLLMKGNFLDTHANITDEATEQPVAHIDREFFNARQLLGGQQTYVVTVAPNVDMALIAAMCICLDEKRNEEKYSG